MCFWALQVPDGVAEAPWLPVSSSASCLLLGDSSASASASASDSQDPSLAPTLLQSSVELQHPLSCYICQKPFLRLHFFYHQLCPDCAAFNYSKRSEAADLTGRVCLVTGGRTKIGFRAALKLLQCGASVIVTTRFPVNASSRFAAEKDSACWMHRLQV
jgi:3-oxoacyl-ACP reductase-like protein